MAGALRTGGVILGVFGVLEVLADIADEAGWSLGLLGIVFIAAGVLRWLGELRTQARRPLSASW